MARVDYYNDPNAPKANSIAVAVSAFIQDEDGRILMIRRTDNDLYALPGGQLELGETVAQAAVREVREETGIECEITEVIGIFFQPGPRYRIRRWRSQARILNMLPRCCHRR